MVYMGMCSCSHWRNEYCSERGEFLVHCVSPVGIGGTGEQLDCLYDKFGAVTVRVWKEAARQ
jgi:hypothetical protein